MPDEFDYIAARERDPDPLTNLRWEDKTKVYAVDVCASWNDIENFEAVDGEIISNYAHYKNGENIMKADEKIMRFFVFREKQHREEW